MFAITKETILSGIESGFVSFEPDGIFEDIICHIGEHWFYFGGTETEGMSMETFKGAFDNDTCANMVVDAIEGLDETEREYYRAYLEERFAKKGR